MNPKIKGVIAALASATGYSLVYIFAKLAQREVETRVFLFWWFFFASLWSLVLLFSMKRGFSQLIDKIKAHPWFFAYFGFSEAFATFLFFYLVKKMNPSFISFIVNLQPLFVIFWGYLIISEKLNFYEGIGGALAIGGTVILTYAEPDVTGVFLLLLFLMVGIYSFNTVLVRMKVRDISPVHIAVFRIYVLFLLYSLFLFSTGQIKFPSPFALANILAGSLFGPVLATIFLFVALKYLKAANVSIIKSVQPFLVLLLSYWFLHQGLRTSQIMGGVLIIIGINILIVGNRAGIRRALSEK